MFTLRVDKTALDKMLVDEITLHHIFLGCFTPNKAFVDQDILINPPEVPTVLDCQISCQNLPPCQVDLISLSGKILTLKEWGGGAGGFVVGRTIDYES
jgi:hypothetical protein